jgi:hypothetical protein
MMARTKVVEHFFTTAVYLGHELNLQSKVYHAFLSDVSGPVLCKMKCRFQRCIVCFILFAFRNKFVK